MHISVILATVPCLRPWLNAFESGGLHGPGEAAHRDSRRPNLMVPKLAPLLPIAMSPMTSDEDIASTLGAAGHRQRVEAWPLELFVGDVAENRTTTIVEHDPVEAREIARKKSLDSESSRGITRTTSFSVTFEEVKQYMQQQQSPRTPPQLPPKASSRPCGLLRTTSHHASLEFRDAGGLLEEVPKARLKSKTGSVVSI